MIIWLKAMLTVLLLFNIKSLCAQTDIDPDTLLKTIPAVAKALSKGDPKIEQNKKNKKLKHPKLIDNLEKNECVSFACAMLGSFGCDSEQELTQVKKICTKHKATDCLKYICDELGSFGCDSFLEMEYVATSCKGVQDITCMKYTCDQLGSFSCDSVVELSAAANACKGVDTECIKSTCNCLLYTSPSPRDS